MHYTRRSLILIATLSGLVVFFIGLNLGKHIQRLDSTYMPPTPTAAVPTPAIKPSPAMNADVEYSRVRVEECGVSFLLPSTMARRTAAAENEAEFGPAAGTAISGSEPKLYVTCNDTFVATQEESLTEPGTATASATIAGQRVTTFTQSSSVLWIVRNNNRQRVLFESSAPLAPLVQQTMEIE